MILDKQKINRILARNEILKTYVNDLANSVDKCSNGTPSDMYLTKGHLDFIYRTQKLLDTDDYNIINDLVGEIGTTFKKCKCKTT